MTMQQQQLMAFGLGYSAQATARRLMADGWAVSGTVRSEDKAARLKESGIDALVFDGGLPPSVKPGSHWLISAPPDDAGCPIFEAFGDQAGDAASITYLSTTGVYGDLDGNWAFEWTKTNPMSPRADRRVLAESQWKETGAPFRTVRLPGIYGPGRSPFERLHKGRARRIIKSGQVFSRIHVDDIASGLAAMMRRPDALGVFHLCDDLPAPPQDVIAYAAELSGQDIPPDTPFETADLSPMARSFYSECKRVSNARAKSALDWFPKYKTYKDGLKAVLAAEQET